MATFKRIEVLNTLLRQSLLPLFYLPDVETAKKVLKACSRGGANLMEFTNRGDYAHEVFAELNKFCRKELPEMILGIGSVSDPGTASLYLQSGANFVVSASLKEDIALVCNRRKVAYIPGCASLTEIGKAEELGCEIVKLFPGSVAGPNFVKAVLGPQPWTHIMPTGGVSPNQENLKSWFEAGVVCVGMGSKLIKRDWIQAHDFVSMEEEVRNCLNTIKEIKAKLQ